MMFQLNFIELVGFNELYVVCMLSINVVELVDVIKNIVIRINDKIDVIIVSGQWLSVLNSIVLFDNFVILKMFFC